MRIKLGHLWRPALNHPTIGLGAICLTVITGVLASYIYNFLSPPDETDLKTIKQAVSKIEQLTENGNALYRAQLLSKLDNAHRERRDDAKKIAEAKERNATIKEIDSDYNAALADLNSILARLLDIDETGTIAPTSAEFRRVWKEEGLDAAIDYAASQRESVLKSIKDQKAVDKKRNRLELQPLLKVATVKESVGKLLDARAYYEDILSVEPEWTFVLSKLGEVSLKQEMFVAATKLYPLVVGVVQFSFHNDPKKTQHRVCISAPVQSLVENMVIAKRGLNDANNAFARCIAVSKEQLNSDPNNQDIQNTLASCNIGLGHVAFQRFKLSAFATHSTRLMQEYERDSSPPPNGIQGTFCDSKALLKAMFPLNIEN
ncbi:MAG: hypothetical protein LWW97_09670 [Deltaproteobacteria bacterium]|nr:hypothetical protein [Deltaproteobacteria bacterium]